MKGLIVTVNSQDKKIQSLSKPVLFLEPTLLETQFQSLIVTNTSDLLKIEPDKLKQCSRRSFLVISGVELPRNKKKWKGRRNTDKSAGTIFTGT